MIPNFAIVDEGSSDKPGVYRGGQPVTIEDWDYLRNLGVQQVIKLNSDSEGSDDLWMALGGELFKVKISLVDQTLGEPDIQELLSAVAFIRPGTFIHCGSVERSTSVQAAETNTQGGQDRTGLVVGAYRLSQGWSKDRAYAEMKAHGFHPELFGLAKAWADLPG